MNLGHRQDTLIARHGDWNHTKTSKIVFDLAEDIEDAKTKYTEKRNHLSISYSENVPQWQGLSRTPSKLGKEAVSVYKHDTTKVPSQKAIYEKMLNDQQNFKSSMVPKSKIARFLDSAIKIQENQRKLANLIKDTSEHELQSRKTEIEKPTTKLRTQIVEFRKVQTQIMPKVGDRVAAQALKPPALQLECLYIPSDFDAAARKKLGLDELAAEEAIWREGRLDLEPRQVHQNDRRRDGCLGNFLKMELVWLELAPLQPLDRPGAAAYARQKAAMYQRRASEAYTRLKELGYESLLRRDANLLEFVEQERKKQADFIRSSVAALE
ncbi:hypothetical protein R3P38DRAFT_3522443 [Favolaschia claudopus]|uniref:Uncharacterized protein n=1 Tax=Favolaschia claudopus TaxID=2862362 RepID=A0AAW0E5T6_9AGAR